MKDYTIRECLKSLKRAGCRIDEDKGVVEIPNGAIGSTNWGKMGFLQKHGWKYRMVDKPIIKRDNDDV